MLIYWNGQDPIEKRNRIERTGSIIVIMSSPSSIQQNMSPTYCHVVLHRKQHELLIIIAYYASSPERK